MKPYLRRIDSRVGILLLLGVTLFCSGVFLGYRQAPVVDKVTGAVNIAPSIPLSEAATDTAPVIRCTDASGADVSCDDTAKVKDRTVIVHPNAPADFTQFWKAWNLINDRYVPVKGHEATNQEKVWGAISGLAASLGDPYTFFMPPKEAKLFNQDVSGEFGGVGMQIGLKDGAPTVIAPLKDSPAERKGILKGDKILAIDDASTTSMTIDAILFKIRGDVGKPVRITVLHPGDSAPKTITIVREQIQAPTVDTEVKDDVFVIHLYSFTKTGPELFRKAIQAFQSSGKKYLVLDVRGNPGGYLEVAVDMASWFLPQGKIVVEEHGRGDDVQVYRSAGYDPFSADFKMAMLVDGGSASAAEILAGALSQHGVATLIGTKTFGKGSVQELIPITPDTSLKVTVARWVMPNGKTLTEGGLDPDVNVPVTKDDEKAGKDPQMERAIQFLHTGK